MTEAAIIKSHPGTQYAVKDVGGKPAIRTGSITRAKAAGVHRDEHSLFWKSILCNVKGVQEEAPWSNLVVGFGGHCVGYNNQAAVHILKRGISSSAIGQLSTRFGVPVGEMALLLDVDRTTVQRRASKGQALPTHTAENVLRVLELEQMANDTFESEEAAHKWLRRSHPMLDGESPLEAAKTSYGARRVKEILVAIVYGGVV